MFAGSNLNLPHLLMTVTLRDSKWLKGMRTLEQRTIRHGLMLLWFIMNNCNWKVAIRGPSFGHSWGFNAGMNGGKDPNEFTFEEDNTLECPNFVSCIVTFRQLHSFIITQSSVNLSLTISDFLPYPIWLKSMSTTHLALRVLACLCFFP